MMPRRDTIFFFLQRDQPWTTSTTKQGVSTTTSVLVHRAYQYSQYISFQRACNWLRYRSGCRAAYETGRPPNNVDQLLLPIVIVVISSMVAPFASGCAINVVVMIFMNTKRWIKHICYELGGVEYLAEKSLTCLNNVHMV